METLSEATRMIAATYPKATFLPFFLLAVLVGLAACAPRPVADSGSAGALDSVTVEGRVSMRGNVPFARPVLITSENNWYVLRMSEEQRSNLMTPALVRVTGHVSSDDWNGRQIAHLDVDTIERIDS